jgi:hypothetical protein
MSHSRDHSRGKQFFFFETSAISTSSRAENQASPQEQEDSQPPAVRLNALAADLSSNIALALSFLFKDRLVFLSKNFAICSAQIRWGPGPLSPGPVARSCITTTTMTTTTASRRHSARGAVEDIVQELFALPGDWISGDCLSVCSIWGMERSLLCPRNGEAAVVKCAALA